MSKYNRKQLKEFGLKLFLNDVTIYLDVFGTLMEVGIENDKSRLTVTIYIRWELSFNLKVI